MKAYFTASIAAKDQYLPHYKAIIDYIKSKNISVISDHIIKTTESSIRMESKESRIKFHQQLEEWIMSCDFMIVEASFPSISVGYEISLALRVGKPVLILYSEGDPPSLLAYHKDDKLVCAKYTLSNLKSHLDEFINYIELKHDLRFTFFITPHIMHYLDQISKKEKIPKSVYLRKLIEKDMQNRD